MSKRLSTEIVSFAEIPDRDAWATIRGYVYQVQVTIIKWLNLPDNGLLELEKGEDIDIVIRDINSQEVSRDLGQVKHLENGFSLNQRKILDIILNCFIHKRDNSSLKVLFTFITNSVSLVERPSLFGDSTKGVDAWVELYQLESLDYSDRKYVGLREHLKIKVDEILNDPTESNLSDWKEFRGFLNNDSLVAGLIQDFQWSYGNQSVEDLDRTILDKLSQDDRIGQQVSIKDLYSRLFFFVFKTLSIKGRKSLTPNELINQFSLPPLTEGDTQLLQNITSILDLVKSKISVMESQIKSNQERISALTRGKIETEDLTFYYRSKIPNNALPTLVKNGSERRKKVEYILDKFSRFSWVSIHGINGTGKTQLALLTTSKYEEVYWFDIRPFYNDLDKLDILFRLYLSNITGSNFEGFDQNWIDKVTQLLPDSIFVFNDIPRTGENVAFDNLLVGLVNALKDRNIKLLTTSNHEIGIQIKDILDSDSLVEYTDVEFDIEELEECLTNNKAPDAVLKLSSLIASVTDRNPSLVSAVIRYLKRIDWGRGETDIYEVFFRKSFDKEIVQNAQLSIKKLIANEESKELLYRLSLVNWTIELEQIKSVASVPKPITHVSEKLTDISNIWVQELGDNSYQISPIIYRIGEDNLSHEVVKGVHFSLAMYILNKGRVDLIGFSRAFSSLVQAEEYNTAGHVLMRLYQSAETHEEASFLAEWGYMYVWNSTAFPIGMDEVLVAYILNEQIRLKSLLEEDTTKSYNKLESLLKIDSLSIGDQLTIRFLCLSNYHKIQFENAAAHIEQLLINYSIIGDVLEGTIKDELIFSLLRVYVKDISTKENLFEWLRLIDLAENYVGISFFDNEVSEMLITVIGQRIVSGTNFKLTKQTNYQDILKQFSDYFKVKGIESLEAVLLKEVINHLLKDDEEQAVKLAKESLGRMESTIAKYLLSEGIGKQYYLQGKKSKSRFWLTQAVESSVTAHSTYPDTLIYYACIITEESKIEAVKHCASAVDLAYKLEKKTTLSTIELMCELAVAYWLNTEFENSHSVFEKVVTELFQLKEEGKDSDKNWIRLLRLAGHAMGYISADIRKTHIPRTADGEEYIRPNQGFFAFNNHDHSDLYKEEESPIIFIQLAYLSEGIDRTDRASYWALKAFDLSRSMFSPRVFSMVQMASTQFFIEDFKVIEAIESHLFFAAVTTHLPGSGQRLYKSLMELDVLEIFGSKPSDEWNQAEDHTLSFAVTPLFIMALNSQYDKDPQLQGRAEEFLSAVKSFIPKASNTELWELIFELTRSILNHEISLLELTQRANTFGESNRQNFQILCSLGIIHLTKNYEHMIGQVINIFPYIVKLSSATEGIIRYALYPFVKNLSILALKETFVGSKDELQEIMGLINDVDVKDENCIQLLLQPTAKEMELKMPEDKRSWLFEFKDIVLPSNS